MVQTLPLELADLTGFMHRLLATEHGWYLTQLEGMRSAMPTFSGHQPCLEDVLGYAKTLVS